MALPIKYKRSDDLIKWLGLFYDEVSTAISDLAAAILDIADIETDLATVITDLNTAEAALAKQNTVVDLTGASSDYDLSVGETAKIDVTAASTALNIAVEDGVYDIFCEFDISTFNADRSIRLQVNNTDYTGEFVGSRFAASTAFTTDEVDAAEPTADNHLMSFGVSGNGDIRPYRIDSRLIINGNRSSLFSESFGTAGGTRIQGHIRTQRNATPAHTSLGTLSIGEVATGIVYVHRVA